jgi:5-methylcytosine-specific restriction endonuclease McrA
LSRQRREKTSEGHRAEKKKQQAKKRRAERRAYVLSICGIKCQFCGNKNSLEFHHLDEEDREFALASNMDRKLSVLEEEAEKCITLCRECHIEEHRRLRSEKQ